MAPLNYDRFFKKVFSDIEIAKAFLEDIFDLEIQEIEQLKEKHRVTDDARVVEFDYRCKIDDQYIIIDMQQWHKPDIAHRFYIYHAVNSSLQLENLPTKKLIIGKNNKTLKVKDYRLIEPVITLVWMVDDVFGNENDFLSFVMTPEDVVEFVKAEALWERNDIDQLFDKRECVLKILNNKEKNIDFISKNKLIFAFQKNIVNNPKHHKYFNWFKFAEISLNTGNKEKDFNQISQDEHFKKIYLKCKKRLATKELSENEITYLHDEEESQSQIKRYVDGITAEKINDLNWNHEKELTTKNKVIEIKDKELKNKDKELEDKAKEIKDKAKEIKNNAKELENNAKELENKAKEIEKLKAMLNKN